jgi:hypothetical protein
VLVIFFVFVFARHLQVSPNELNVCNFSLQKAFKKDLSLFEQPDEFCPHCGNLFAIPAELPDDQ